VSACFNKVHTAVPVAAENPENFISEVKICGNKQHYIRIVHETSGCSSSSHADVMICV